MIADEPSQEPENEPVESHSAPLDDAASAVQKLSDREPEKLARITEVMAMGMTSVGNPLHGKMTGEHVSQVLELAAKHDERQYELNRDAQRNEYLEGRSQRILTFLTFFIVAGLVAAILYLFREQPEVLIPLLTGIGGTGAGFLGGWGYGRRQR